MAKMNWGGAARRSQVSAVGGDRVPRQVVKVKRPKCRHYWGGWNSSVFGATRWRVCQKCKRRQVRRPDNGGGPNPARPPRSGPSSSGGGRVVVAGTRGARPPRSAS